MRCVISILISILLPVPSAFLGDCISFLEVVVVVATFFLGVFGIFVWMVVLVSVCTLAFCVLISE